MEAVYGILGGADRAELRAIGARLEHRGPESAEWSPAEGVWFGVRGSVAVVGRQREGAVVFVGSIDNRRELARGLGRASQTAEPARDGTLAAELWEAYGEEGLARIAGQFAFALWDARNRRLVLARDRVGYAPLYFALDGERLIFASEYKALLAIASVPAVANRAALQAIHNTKWVLPGFTCLQGVHPVAPGTLMEVQEGRSASRRYLGHPGPCRGPATKRDMRRACGRASSRRSGCRRSRTQRIGVSLSGGLDSAVVAAGARRVVGDREVHTFSAGYGPDDRELVNAAIVARDARDESTIPSCSTPRICPACCPGWSGTSRSRSAARTSRTCSSRRGRRRATWI